MSRFLKVISAAGGVGTIAGIAGVTVLATQAEEGAKVVYLYSTKKERPTGGEFGLDFSIEDVKRYREIKEFRKYKKDKESLDKQKTTLEAEIKDLEKKKQELAK